MQKQLTLKIFLILLISLILLIPLALITNMISEREAYLHEAKYEVAKSWTAEQTITAPLLVIPYVISQEYYIVDSVSKERLTKTREVNEQAYLVADTVQIDANIDNSIRMKGIFRIGVYSSSIDISGAFDAKSLKQNLDDIQNSPTFIRFETPYLSAHISDTRGISNVPSLTWQNQALAFLPSSRIDTRTNGIHVELPSLYNEIASEVPRLNYAFTLELRGMEAINFVPVGKSTSVKASSNWPHPIFEGNFLPSTREISETGYKASWQTTSFATNIERKVNNCQKGECDALFQSGFGVRHNEPVDNYLQSERSSKYGILFIGLSFIAFFIFEIIKKLPIHPIQYTLVGVAMAIFYLLLISLSEQMAFLWAYLIASFCCVGLLLFYLKFVLGEFKYAVIFAACLSLLYFALYIIISAEDLALVMGAFLTFISLAIVMFSTRKINWYELSQPSIKSKEFEAKKI